MDLKNSKDKKTDSNQRYAGMAFEMVGIMIVGGFVGTYIDNYMETTSPYYTAGLMLFLLLTYFIKIYYALTHSEK